MFGFLAVCIRRTAQLNNIVAHSLSHQFLAWIVFGRPKAMCNWQRCRKWKANNAWTVTRSLAVHTSNETFILLCTHTHIQIHMYTEILAEQKTTTFRQAMLYSEWMWLWLLLLLFLMVVVKLKHIEPHSTSLIFNECLSCCARQYFAIFILFIF